MSVADIRFYHTLHRPPREILVDLLEKARAKGEPIAIRVADDMELAILDDYLWTYTADSFLPHGLNEEDTVRLGGEEISASILFLMPDSDCNIGSDVSLCCLLIDGQNQSRVLAARQNWKVYKDQGHSLTYWQQSEQGKWEQKA